MTRCVPTTPLLIGQILQILTMLTFSAVSFADTAEFALQLKVNQNQLSTLVKNMEATQPTRGSYSPEEIRDQTAISANDYGALVWSLKRIGQVRETRSHHYLILKLNLPSWINAQLAPLENNQLGRSQFLQNYVTMSLPANLRNLITSFLDPALAPKIGPRIARLAKDSSGSDPVYPPSAVHSVNDLPGVHPDTIRDWYGITALRNKYGLTGRGQSIAAISFGPVSPANVVVYNSIVGITGQPQIKVISDDTPEPTRFPTNEVENDLDLEMASNVAPGAQLYSFNGNDINLVDWVETLDNILDRDDIKIITNSYMGIGFPTCETQSITPAFSAFMDPLFDRAVAQGVTVINAAGDDGSDGCADGTVAIEWPQSPDILQAGGTQMNLGSTPQSITEELAWKSGAGGESILYWKPDWMSTPAAGYAASLSHRAEPDLSWYSDADYPPTGNIKIGQPVFTINPWQTNPDFSAPVWSSIGGTSLAAPSLAGFLALVNEARGRVGKPPLLYVTPMLYRVPVARTASTPFVYADVFNDIVDGNNGAFYAHTGWDMTTGLGTPKGEALLNYLVAQ